MALFNRIPTVLFTLFAVGALLLATGCDTGEPAETSNPAKPGTRQSQTINDGPIGDDIGTAHGPAHGSGPAVPLADEKDSSKEEKEACCEDAGGEWEDSLGGSDKCLDATDTIKYRACLLDELMDDDDVPGFEMSI